ncbi:hypothetical protein HSX37_18110|uniref:ACT domain-containing protein n=1 Tax=Dendrosporobacter quercicolus TaxID=146817 RepID=A0A1G9UB57_9FIRM|nr:ACT domain-containing protein [Dendrosporobacter quercicolus]NSL49934.1 hypothetical protein [Dendrosporobacter quercicolus DSM 1736]SDM57082.1 ACT domain-containing protein [Dendrosporobacter quercicolus]
MKQILSITLKNQPDALVRLVGVVYRRGFAVESLSVTPAPMPNYACVKAVVNDCLPPSGQLLQQIRKLVHVESAELLPTDYEGQAKSF